MSADEKAAKELVETLKDGRDGFASAAEKLRDSDRPEGPFDGATVMRDALSAEPEALAAAHFHPNGVGGGIF